MKSKSIIQYLLLLVIIGISCGCNLSKTNAESSVRKELAEREVRAGRSARLIASGLEARKKGDLQLAQSRLSEAVHIDPSNDRAWMALGVIEYELDDYYKSAQAFHRATRLLPDRYEPRFNLGSVFEAAGKINKAIDEYENALRLAPDSVETMENLVRCYVRSNRNLSRALELTNQALEMETRPEWREWLLKQSVLLPSRIASSPILTP